MKIKRNIDYFFNSIKTAFNLPETVELKKFTVDKRWEAFPKGCTYEVGDNHSNFLFLFTIEGEIRSNWYLTTICDKLKTSGLLSDSTILTWIRFDFDSRRLSYVGETKEDCISGYKDFLTTRDLLHFLVGLGMEASDESR